MSSGNMREGLCDNCRNRGVYNLEAYPLATMHGAEETKHVVSLVGNGAKRALEKQLERERE